MNSAPGASRSPLLALFWKAVAGRLSMLPSVLLTECPPVLVMIMMKQDHDHHPRHDESQYTTCIPLPSDTFHDKLFPCDQGDDAEYDHDPRGGTVALYATCMPLPSDTFHEKLFACPFDDP